MQNWFNIRITEKGAGFLLSLLIPFLSVAQQVQWAQVYPLVKSDKISCITKDEDFIYAGGYTYRNALYFNTTPYYKAYLMKLDLNGDTLFTMDLGVSGEVMSMALDPYGNIRANVKQYYFGLNGYNTFLFQIHPSGFIFKTDTIIGVTPAACLIGKDSSLILVGYKGRTGFPGERSMYFWRMDKNGTMDSWIELNPGHPDCAANRIEQLPNGHYLVSGYVGSRIASYELNEDGSNPVFKQWYQTPDLSNMTSGHVGQLGNKNWMIGGQGNPSVIGALDSMGNKKWMRREDGQIIPPQAMTDHSVVFGYRTGIPPYQVFYRMGIDSNYIWNMAFHDSLNARGLVGNVTLTCFSFFEDESAVVAGNFSDGTGITGQDPIFLRIANVGTPVTSLSKPKRGTLSNETLAPWPNPSVGTLYLRQHFDKAEVHFYTVSGREVQTDTVRFGQPIDISSFAPGLYLYRAVIDGKPFSGKVVRQ